MIYTTHVLRRAELGFLTRRIVKLRPAPLPARWMKVSMVTCWIAACGLALTLNMIWLP